MKTTKTVFAVLLILFALSAVTRPVQAGPACPDSFEPNDSVDRAYRLSAGSYDLSICLGGDEDFFFVDVQAGETITVRLSNLSEDIDLFLYSSNRNSLNLVASSENYDAKDENVQYTSQIADRLFIHVYGYLVNSSYRISLSRSGSSLDPQVANPSAQIQQELVSLRPLMSQTDFDSLVELIKYAKDTAKCMAAVKSWKAAGVILAHDPGLVNACGMMANKILSVVGKYFMIKTDAVGGYSDCQTLYFNTIARGSLTEASPYGDYCFEVGGRQPVSIRIAAGSGNSSNMLDVKMDLYNEKYQLAGSTDGKVGIGPGSFLSLSLPGGGIYRLSVQRRSGSGSFSILLQDGSRAAAADVNADCVVNDNDGQAIQSALGKNDLRYDVDLSGSVNSVDYAIYQQFSGTHCQNTSTMSTPAPWVTINYNNYCIYKYGNGASAVMSNSADAYSWGCYKGSAYAGGFNMDEACAVQYPSLPKAVMGNRWDANSWHCTR